MLAYCQAALVAAALGGCSVPLGSEQRDAPRKASPTEATERHRRGLDIALQVLALRPGTQHWRQAVLVDAVFKGTAQRTQLGLTY